MKVLLPFSCDNLQIIQTILWFYHLSAYAHLPQSDSLDHYKYLVALPHYPELLQAVFGLPISHASPFPRDCTRQPKILFLTHPIIKDSMTRLNISQTSGRKGFLRFLNCRLHCVQMVSQSLLQTVRSFYQDPHMLCSLPSCKCVFWESVMFFTLFQSPDWQMPMITD